MIKAIRIRLPFVLLLTLFAVRVVVAGDALEEGFRTPPDSAKPHTWWHWMNGNITREGITADLEAMKRVGISGAQVFNVDSGIPRGPVRFLSQEWRDLMVHAAKEADRLGIELCLHNCGGWSSSGGPWNTPENAMQHITTSEVQIAGPTNFSDTLPQPRTQLNFYRDIAVLAFRTPAGEGVNFRTLAPKVTTGVSNIVGEALIDGNSATFITLPPPTADQPQYAQIEFAEAFPVRTVVLTARTNASECKGVIQVSDDGAVFRDVRSFAFGRRPTRPLGVSLGTGSLPAKFYRILFFSAAKGATGLSLAEIDLSPRARIENFETKMGETGGLVGASSIPGEVDPSCVVSRTGIVDLTDRLGSDGHLEWDVPAGEWTILRVGYTPTGRNNHPAPEEATGLECDKLSAVALDAHWRGFVQKVIDDLGPLAGKSLNNVLIDSYEVGGQNWTATFAEEFQRRRGYDLRLYLPAFTGRVVDNPEISERFAWDIRRTISDLFAENYYGHFQKLCHERGLQASIEPYTGPFESLQCGAPADIPMGEFWLGQKTHSSLKLAASVGHIYGRPVIGAESFTAAPGSQHGRWMDDAYSMKALGDLVFCQGINRYIFHRYAMQPWTNRWPGMTMGQWGTHFDRTSTWWEQERAWLQYVARCQFLLQQGRFAADVAYFCGESAPAELRIDTGEFALPEGYDYDGVGADVLLRGAKVEGGQLVLNSGMRYRVLVLPPSDQNIRPELLRKLRDCVQEGLTLVGHPPQTSPSLERFPQCDTEVQQLVREMWGDELHTNVTTHKFGGGKVVRERLGNALTGLGVLPDFEFGPRDGAQLAFIHRTDSDAEIYFVSNQRERFEVADCTFRVTGKMPELWHPDTGVIEEAPVWSERGGRTTVSLQFEPAGSVFVVFRRKAQGDHLVAVRCVTPRNRVSKIPDDLRILKAVYAPIDAVADVTSTVSSMVAAGTRTILAGNSLAVDDPAPGLVKRLRIEFVANGERHVIEASEGKSVMLPPDCRVVKASFGTLSTGPLPTLDVTDQVHSLVSNGSRQIPASNEMAGEDPAPNFPKKLRIDYRVGTQARVVEADEGKSVDLPRGAEVQRATYGAENQDAGARFVDLTQKLAGQVRQGELTIVADNDLAGRDPAPNVTKELRVHYSLNNVPGHVTVKEGDTLALGVGQAMAGLAPSFHVEVEKRGLPQVMVGEPGSFVLDWVSGRQVKLSSRSIPPPIAVTGSWELNFPPGWGAPERITLDDLQSWTESTNAGVKYFSGTASYRKEVLIPKKAFGSNRQLWLNLGQVKNFAEVSLNGVDLGILWRPPFRVNITGCARPGRNRLEIKVTNLWPNRLIGDEQLPPDCEWQGKQLRTWPDWLMAGKPSPTGRLTFTTWHHWTKESPLLESGLLGPVRIESWMMLRPK